jgi:hypothetical protein
MIPSECYPNRSGFRGKAFRPSECLLCALFSFFSWDCVEKEKPEPLEAPHHDALTGWSRQW